MIDPRLCQTGMWIESAGACCDPDAASGLGDTAGLRIRSETPYGRLSHLGPVVEISATPAHWVRPTVPLGTNPAEWPAG